MSDWPSLQQKYRREIKPLMEMLRHKQSELPYSEWINLVRKTEQHIINSPDQYVSELPKKGELNLVVHHLFNEFLNESF